MIVEHKDTEFLAITIQDVVVISKANALQNFKQYLDTKMLELEQALSRTLFVMPESISQKSGIIYEGNQRKSI